MGVGTQRLDFAEFYRVAKDQCLFTVLVSVGDRDVAQELVAEAFARAWASWRTVSEHPEPRAWVVRIYYQLVQRLPEVFVSELSSSLSRMISILKELRREDEVVQIRSTFGLPSD